MHRSFENLRTDANPFQWASVIKNHDPERNFRKNEAADGEVGDEKTKAAFERSIERLQLDNLDLHLIHQPDGEIYSAWRDMEKLYAQGKIRAIGVNDFQHGNVMDL